MPDVLTPEQRHRNMAAIRSKNTGPEIAVRSLVHRLGLRFSLHRRDLPGTPDLTFPKHKKTIFVHGCFWHMHKCRFGRVVPKTNAAFWRNKRTETVIRDSANLCELRKLGWSSLVVWECQLRKPKLLRNRIVKFFDLPNS
jgi:DNA mismatch endonuclease (patch repair protein)